MKCNLSELICYILELKKTEDMSNFKKRYRDLEMEVHNSLRDAINNSDIESAHVNTKAIRFDELDMKEIVVIDDRLVLLDSDGQHYPIFSVSLEDLIDAI